MADQPVSMKQLFEAMPQYVNQAAIEGVNKVVQFNVTGDDTIDYYIHVADGTVTSHEGVASEPNLTITTPSDVWMDISTGQLNGAVAFMTGKFKATGELGLLMAMQNWFNLPS